MPGLEHGREEVIAAGAVILSTVMELLGRDEVLVSDYGLREGVLIESGKSSEPARLVSLFATLHKIDWGHREAVRCSLSPRCCSSRQSGCDSRIPCLHKALSKFIDIG